MVLLVSQTGCNQRLDGCREHPNADPLANPVRLERLDIDFWKQDTTPTAIKNWMDTHQDFLKKYLESQPEMNDSSLLAFFVGMRKDRYLDTMQRETVAAMGDLKDVETDYNTAFANLKHYYPNAKVPRVMTFITGFTFDVSMADSSLIILGLESFMGGKGHYLPPIMPMYMLKRMKRNTIVPLTVLGISNKYNKRDILDNSMAADMIHWGKAYYFMERLLPCVDDSTIIGFTPEQMAYVKSNEKQIYGQFIERKLMFMTSHIDKRRYVDERPTVPEINEKCPGRIARYLGWQMVRAYAKSTGKSLQEIMAEPSAQIILNKSQYKPE